MGTSPVDEYAHILAALRGTGFRTEVCVHLGTAAHPHPARPTKLQITNRR
jgi:hypothetical protein